MDAALGRRVGRQVGVGHNLVHRGQVHDAATARAHHGRKHCPAGAKHRGERRIDGVLPLLVGATVRRAFGVGHGIVDQNVNPPKALNNACHQGLHACTVGHVHLLHPGSGQSCLQRLGRSHIALERDHLPTLRHEMHGDGFTDAATGTCDDAYLVLKSHDLTAPAVRPWMKKRCRKAKPITTGKELTMDAAIAPPQSFLLSPM